MFIDLNENMCLNLEVKWHLCWPVMVLNCLMRSKGEGKVKVEVIPVQAVEALRFARG
jgi:hypothetical protein